MDYSAYKELVSLGVHNKRKARGSKETCCTDTIQRSFQNGKTVEEAIDIAELDTAYWEGELM